MIDHRRDRASVMELNIISGRLNCPLSVHAFCCRGSNPCPVFAALEMSRVPEWNCVSIQGKIIILVQSETHKGLKRVTFPFTLDFQFVNHHLWKIKRKKITNQTVGFATACLQLGASRFIILSAEELGTMSNYNLRETTSRIRPIWAINPITLHPLLLRYLM